MGRSKSSETIIHNATSTSSSLRTTIPEHIVEKLGLNSKNQLKWDVDKENGVWIAKIIKKNEIKPKRTKK